VNPLAAAATPELRDFLESVRRCCTAAGIVLHSRQEQPLPRELWRQLGALGVLGLGADSDATWLAATFCQLGEALCPGPLAATAMALHLLPAGEIASLRTGERVVSVGSGGVFPWGAEADVLIEMAGDAAWVVDDSAQRTPMATLAREPWARVDASVGPPLARGRRAAAFGDLAVAALVLGAAGRLLDMSAQHAAARRQFGRAVGSFQGVAFPLAACYVALHNAQCLLGAAAEALDAGHDARALCAGARSVAAAGALEVARAGHQVHGATGFTEDSPVAAYSTRIRQWTLLPPDETSRRAALLAGIVGEPADVADRATARAVSTHGE
jgi:alkylation response protein AidB-like acyl-CoA dehydrogenase